MDDLVLNGGIIHHGVNGTVTLDGQITVRSDSSIDIDDSGAARVLQLNAAISDDLVNNSTGDITANGLANQTREVVLNASNPNYTGKWIMNNTDLTAKVDGALAGASVTLNNHSTLTIDGTEEDINALEFSGTATTVEMTGAKLNVNSITQTGSGNLLFHMDENSALNFLKFGTSDAPLDFEQINGTVSVLGTDAELWGNFSQLAGDLLLDLDTQALTIHGTADISSIILTTSLDAADLPNLLATHLTADSFTDLDNIQGVLLNMENEMETAVDFVVQNNELYAVLTGGGNPDPQGVPEPATWLLMILGSVSLLYCRRRTH